MFLYPGLELYTIRNNETLAFDQWVCVHSECGSFQTTVELGYIRSLRTAKFIRYIRNPIYTTEISIVL